MLMISELMPDQHTKPGIQLLYYIFLSYTTRTYIVLTIFFCEAFWIIFSELEKMLRGNRVTTIHILLKGLLKICSSTFFAPDYK